VSADAVSVARPPAADQPLPDGFGIVLDAGTRRWDGGRGVLGGSPLRLLRLSPPAATVVADWISGQPVRGVAAGRLARRLTDGGLAHPRPHGGPSPAEVTVVVPVRGRVNQLRRCLAALGPDSAIVVVDDASPDPARTRAVVAAFGAQCLVRERQGGPAAARNTGLAAAATPYVAFVDSDCVVTPGWLSAVLMHFADSAVGAVAPRVLSATRRCPNALERYELVRSPLDLGPTEAGVRPLSRVAYVPAAALVVRRAACGAGFAEAMRLGEDVDFVWRLIEAGWRIRYEPGATVAHDPRGRLSAWLHQRIGYGTSAAPLAQGHPGLVAPAAVSEWSVAAWALLLAGRPATGLGVVGVATALQARQLRQAGEPARLAVRLVGTGTWGAGRQLAGAALRAWWPVLLPAAVLSRPVRRGLLAAAVLPALDDWRRRRPELDPVRYVALSVLDDLAYGWGVWRGCGRQRTVAPLLPRLRVRWRRPSREFR